MTMEFTYFRNVSVNPEKSTLYAGVPEAEELRSYIAFGEGWTRLVDGGVSFYEWRIVSLGKAGSAIVHLIGRFANPQAPEIIELTWRECLDALIAKLKVMPILR
jgi:hypothetical protein